MSNSNNVGLNGRRHMKPSFKKYLGYKFFKELDDGSFDIQRVIRVVESGNKHIVLYDENTKLTKKAKIEDLKEYTPLEPFGLASFNIVTMDSGSESLKDVMVLIYKKLNLQLGDYEPYAICRQSVVDFFNDILCQNPEENNLVGISISKDNCPTNVEFAMLAACDSVDLCEVINFYRDDNIESLLRCVSEHRYNKVLEKLNKLHCTNPIDSLKNEKDGWCKDLKTLLTINNFMADFNMLCDITGFDFDLSTELKDREDGVKELSKECLLFFDLTFKVNAVETRVIEYDYSINLADFNNNNYVIIRDINNKLYIVVYLVDGEYLESELEKEANNLSISDKLRLSYYNKYLSN